ncbi:MAG: sialidase family protein [Candidatus Sulfotelmatobacter sp.]
MGFATSRARAGRSFARQSAIFLFIILAAASFAAAQAATRSASTDLGFTSQKRIGFNIGDQWEPAITADGRGHVFILYPQYGAVPGCRACSAPAIVLSTSNDNGISWEPSRALLPLTTGQFDPQIVVDPADRQTLYASWLQNNKRDIVVARSIDFGRSWSFSIAEHSADDADKPVLAVRGQDIYVGFNHDENFYVAASHDAGRSFTRALVNPNAQEGSSLGGGGTVDVAGNVFFGWTAYAQRDIDTRPVSVYVSRSVDAGRTWATTLLDVSGAPPDCEAEGCETGFLGAQLALTSDSAGTIYALWNAGGTNGGPERIYFSSSTTAGATWSARSDVSSAGPAVEHCFPAITAGDGGDVRVAWMDTRVADEAGHRLWNTFYRTSTNGGATWSAENQLSGPAHGYDYILPNGFRFPFGDYFGLAIDSRGATHATWGEGQNFKSPGSIWYARGR